jgi:hypothetical protein
MHKVPGNYISCTCRSSENICSGHGDAQEKAKTSAYFLHWATPSEWVHLDSSGTDHIEKKVVTKL